MERRREGEEDGKEKEGRRERERERERVRERERERLGHWFSSQDPEKRHGAALGSLSVGRLGVMIISAGNIRSAVSIAIR